MYKTTFNANEKLWSGRSLPIVYNQNISIGHALLRAMKTCPHKIAQINANNDVQLTFADLYLKTVRAAQNIRKLGFKKGDVFAIMSQNNEQVAPVVMALLCCDYPLNGLQPAWLTETQLIGMLDITKPKLVFSGLESYAMIKKCLKKSRNNAIIYTFCGQVEDSRNVEDLFAETGIEEEFVPANVDAEKDTAMIVWTSGLTGTPKGVSLPHAMLWDYAERYAEPAYRTGHNFLYFGRISAGSGIMFLLMGTIHNLTRVITTDVYSPELLLRIIEKYQISFVCIWPLQLMAALKCEEVGIRDLSSLKFVHTGGARLPGHICNDISRWIPSCCMIFAYGLSESGYIAHNYPYTSVENTVGQLNHGVTVKITDGNGVRLGIGEIGEIGVRKMARTTGYYRNEVKTRKLFDEENFMKTGDIGYFDANGYLYVLDRKEFYLTYRHDSVSPVELEEFLMSYPDIELAFVSKVKDRMLAALVKRTEESQITKEDILDMVRRKFDGKHILSGGVYFNDLAQPSLYTPTRKANREAIQSLTEKFYNAVNRVNSNEVNPPGEEN